MHLHPSDTVSVGEYLARRLKQLGIDHLFGLPGDFNLSLLDEMLATGELSWIGSTNELNAAYTADAYARVRRGFGALVTTYGVGELSAINGIAGSYAEDVPVIQITGSPSTTAARAGTLLHHTLVDGDYDHFLRAYREFTAAAVTVQAQTAATDIDRALIAALRTSKPAYLSIPTDVAVAQIDASNLAHPLTAPYSDAGSLARFTNALRERLTGSSDVTVLAGPRLHRRNLEQALRELAEVPGVRIASQSGSKAIIDESHPRSLGTYLGALTRSAEAREIVDSASPLILAGAVLSDLLTGFFSHGFDPQESVELGLTEARIGATYFYDVTLVDSLRAMRSIVTELGLSDDRDLPTAHAGVEAAPAYDEGMTQQIFWAAIQRWLPSKSVVIADAGTAFYGALELAMPNDSDLLGQPIWSSIGYTVPATLGAALADRERRPILLVGDGAAQLTIQELATILQNDLTPVVFLLNNRGYTVERAIQSPDAIYQNVTDWNWSALPAVFGPDRNAKTLVVKTRAELDFALEIASRLRDRLVFIEVHLPTYDSPAILKELAAGLAAASSAE
jgi:indolepyruvate decarboxylase